MDRPVLLFASCFENCDLYDRLVKPLINTSESNIDIVNSEQCNIFLLNDVTFYNWDIDTKYYNANVAVATCLNPTIGNKEFANCVEAVGLYFDSNDLDSFESVNSWLGYLIHLTPSVLFLICDRIASDGVISKQRALEFCMKNNFELVELNPDEDSDEEDDFKDSYGITRMKQALYAHTWSNLIMKENPQIRSHYMENLIQQEKNFHLHHTHDNCSNNIQSINYISSDTSTSSDIIADFTNATALSGSYNESRSELDLLTNGLKTLETFDDESEIKDNENIFDQMNHLMTEVSKYDVGTEERRDLATKAIVLLYKNLDLSSDDEEDSDNDTR